MDKSHEKTNEQLFAETFDAEGRIDRATHNRLLEDPGTVVGLATAFIDQSGTSYAPMMHNVSRILMNLLLQHLRKIAGQDCDATKKALGYAEETKYLMEELDKERNAKLSDPEGRKIFEKLVQDRLDDKLVQDTVFLSYDRHVLAKRLAAELMGQYGSADPMIADLTQDLGIDHDRLVDALRPQVKPARYPKAE